MDIQLHKFKFIKHYKNDNFFSLNYFAFNYFNFLSCLFFSMILLSSNAHANSPEKIAELINQRLFYMDQIAEYKVKKNLSIEDLDQEEKVINNSKNDANFYGLDSTSIEPFVNKLIKISKSLQYRYINSEKRIINSKNSVKKKDLNQIRQIITSLNRKILKQLAKFLSQKNWNEKTQTLFIEKLYHKNLTVNEKRELSEAIMKIQLNKT